MPDNGFHFEPMAGEAPLEAIDRQYELIKELGRGAAAVIWEARHRQTSEIVAIKILGPEVLSSPQARKRFVREVASLGALRHRHSVRVLGHGNTADGGGFLVMERLYGKTLAACLRENGPLPQSRAIKIVCQILEAVGAAHQLHIVHRDLKPSNVMLVEHGGDPDFVKVCDFGLAKAIDPHELDGEPSGVVVDFRSLTTQDGEICGTPEYMAPEQARGEPVDARTDLYAIAVILFHAVVGHVPFSGRTTLAVVSQHLSLSPPRPSALRPDLGIFPPLEAVILRALAKDRAERPSSADVFRADLLQIERDYRQRARSSETTGLSIPPARVGDTLPALRKGAVPIPNRRPAWMAAAGVTLAGLAAAIAWRGPMTRLLPSDPPERAIALDPSSAPEERAFVVPPLPTQTLAQRDPPPAPAPPTSSTRQQTPPIPPHPRASAAVNEEQPGRPKMEDRAGALLAEGEDRLGRGLITEACVLGDAAAERAPDLPSVWEFLGRCYMRAGQAERARAHYRKYLAIAPKGPDAVFIRAIVGPDSP